MILSKTLLKNFVLSPTFKAKKVSTVEMTKAWITCEIHYLRAWAAFFRLSNRNSGVLKGKNLHEEVSKNGWEV